MKVLFYSDGVLNENTGMGRGARRSLDMVVNIAGFSNVDLILTTGDINPEDLNLKARNIWVINPGITKIRRFTNYFFLRYNISNENHRFIINKFRSEKYDLVFIDNSMYGKVIKSIKKLEKEIPVIAFYHDVKRQLLRSWIKNLGLKYLFQSASIIYNEHLTARHTDCIICLTQRDLALIKKYYNRDADLIPVSFPDQFEADKPSMSDNTSSFNILFVGADYFPNIQGIEWFIDNVLNNIPAKLHILGKGLEKYTYLVKNENVILKGTVSGSELKESYFGADCVIIPIFEGGGMKIKVAEALMFGKYIFGTSEAFIGYDLEFSKVGGLCNSPGEFIDSMNKWWRSYDFNRVNQESRKYFLSTFSNIVAEDLFRNVFRKYVDC